MSEPIADYQCQRCPFPTFWDEGVWVCPRCRTPYTLEAIAPGEFGFEPVGPLVSAEVVDQMFATYLSDPDNGSFGDGAA